MKMVDVGGKPKTERVAIATARVRMKAATVRRIVQGTVEKGDVLAAAQLAGVMAAKHTPDFVPLCHPISLSSVEVEVRTLRTAEAGPGSARLRAAHVGKSAAAVEREGPAPETGLAPGGVGALPVWTDAARHRPRRLCPWTSPPAKEVLHSPLPGRVHRFSGGGPCFTWV